MVAQANKTGTSKNTTNEKEIMTVPLYTHKLQNTIDAYINSTTDRRRYELCWNTGLPNSVK